MEYYRTAIPLCADSDCHQNDRAQVKPNAEVLVCTIANLLTILLAEISAGGLYENKSPDIPHRTH